MRISPITRIMFVLHRSRAASHTAAEAIGGLERRQRLGVAGELLGHLRGEPLALGRGGLLAGLGGGHVVGHAHPLDGGQGQLGVGLPGVGPQVPLVGTREPNS